MPRPRPSPPLPAAPFTRRRFVQSAAVIAGPAWAADAAVAQSAGATTAGLEAFADSTAVKVGDSLDFYVRHRGGSLTVGAKVPFTIARMGVPDRLMLSTTITVFEKKVPANAATNGCAGWGVAYRLPVPRNWPTGLYWATVGTGSVACTVPFVVRPAARTAGVNVLVQIPVTTANAYNSYGGKSLYEYNSTDGIPAQQVSFNRPFDNPWNYAFDAWQPSLVRWLEKNGIAADYCTSMELHQEPKLLSGYRLFVTVGHDEYWSRVMRDRLDAFVAAGGNAAIFSGNTCWWQVRFDDVGGNDRRMICYKSRTGDPGGTAKTKTTNWFDLAPPYPENSTIGLSFVKGASWVTAMPRPTPPFVVKQAGHWAFAGTGLAADGGFGGAYVGYETDAADFAIGTDGRFYPTGLDGSPATLRILAQADCSDWDARAQALGLGGERSGYAAIAVFSRGAGTVFSVGSTDWVFGLNPEIEGQTPTVVSTITRNVIQKLSAAWTETADVRQWHAAVPGNPWSGFDTIGTDAPAGMTLDGSSYRAFAAPVAGTVPVYRFRSVVAGVLGYRYALSTSPHAGSTQGWVRSGVAFHAFNAYRTGTVPVYQHRTTDADGLSVVRYTTADTPASGWVSEGVVFYAPAA